MRLKELTRISEETYKKVLERDGGRCIICGGRDVQCAHYHPRSQGGYGVPQNLVMLCVKHHMALDNGNNPKETQVYKDMVRLYLQTRYPEWEEEKYKWKGKVYESK